jgi:drug/metabolite transporter superfamily protein YnfA
MRFLYAVPPILALGAYLIWRHFAAQVYVGDLPPFDLRLYSYEDARAYLAGLSAAARAVYLGPMWWADLGLMLALAVTLILPLRGRVWAVPAGLYVAFDLLENRVVAQFLTRGIHEVGEAATLSLFTGAKFGFLGLAVILALWGVWQRWRG